MHFLIGEERHHGVAGIMEAVALAGGRLRYRRVPVKAVAAALAIGSGASVAPSRIVGPAYIGEDTQVKQFSLIETSYIGRSCRIAVEVE
ncbi:MAG: hypothetical protein C4309_04405, partial [Chloroflexota bacterium]